MKFKIPTQILHDVVAECQSDYVGLWSIVRNVKKEEVYSDKLIEVTIKLLEILMRDYNIAAGSFEEGTFCIWDQPRDEILHKIASEWRNLGRDPDIGEIVWFISRIKEIKGVGVK